jgi:hypothetical protein
MSLSYRTRRRLGYVGIGALIFLMIAIMLWMIWIIWLDRYVVYNRDGAQLRFDLDLSQFSGQQAQEPAPGETVPIYYNEGNFAVDLENELTQLRGYYADTDAIRKNIYEVREQIERLPAGTAVMLDVKNIAGYFYYSTTLGGKTSDKVDIAAMDELIDYLRTSSLYTIARIPAFRDYHFGLNNVPFGLSLPSGIGLWMDDSGCYWLNPESDGALNYVIQIVNELKGLGFDEVVFSDFCFPDTTKIAYSGDRTAAINQAAEDIAAICTSGSFCVSFISSDPGFKLPQYRCRLYRDNVAAANASSVAQSSGVADPAINLVFLTTTNDTRYDEFGTMRPLDSAHFE